MGQSEGQDVVSEGVIYKRMKEEEKKREGKQKKKSEINIEVNEGSQREKTETPDG